MSVLLTFGQSKRLCVNQSRATGQQRAIRPRRCSIFLCFRERDFERKELKKREFGSLIYQKGSGEEEEKKRIIGCPIVSTSVSQLSLIGTPN